MKGLKQMKSRIIPTRVGTSDVRRRRQNEHKDHPHACGDKEDEPTDDELKEGSSPRVWGQAVNFGFNAPELRIIPTRVGTSRDTEVRYINTEDHPHACGDKTVGLLVTHSHLGSSPRVWGQGWVTQVTASENRIIPTRVGTSNV